MKMRILLCVVLASVGTSSMLWGQNIGGGFGGGGHAFGSGEDTKPVEGIRYVGDLYFKISFDPRVAITYSALSNLLNSPAVVGAAIRDTNKKDLSEELSAEHQILHGDEKLNAVTELYFDEPNEVISSGVAFVSVGIQLLDPDGKDDERDKGDPARYKPVVKRFTGALQKRFEDELNRVVEREVGKQITQEGKAVERERNLAESAAATLAHRRNQLAALASGVPQSVLEEGVSNLQKQHQALELEVAGLKGRAEAVQLRLAKATEEVKNEKQDEVVQNLERVLNLRAQQVERYRQLRNAASISQAEVLKAEEDVALAQVELARAKRLAVKGKTDEADRFNGQLADIAINLAEAQTKLQYVEKQLEEGHQRLQRETTDAAPLREEIQAMSAAAQQMLQNVKTREHELRRLESSTRPTTVESYSREPRGDELNRRLEQSRRAGAGF
jgi:hypothetical protein